MILSFPDCPHKCNSKGLLFDRNLRKHIECDYCKEKRIALSKEGLTLDENTEKDLSLHEALGFKDTYLSPTFVFESLIPEEELGMCTKDSLENVRQAINSLRGTLSSGSVPTSSVCFGLARKGSLDKLAYPLMVTAYTNGISSLLFGSGRIYYDDYLHGRSLDKYHDTVLLFMVIPSGCSYNELAAIRGMLEARATMGNPTVFLTNGNIDEVSHLLGYVSSPSLYLASPYFVERFSTADSHSYHTDKLRGVSLRELKEI